MNEGKFISAKLPISESTRRKNPHLFGAVGGLEAKKPESIASPALAGNPSKHKGSKSRVVVRITLIAARQRLLDDDNSTASFKPLRDAIAATLRIDDGDSRITWEYGQVLTRGREGCVVKIETL